MRGFGVTIFIVAGIFMMQSKVISVQLLFLVPMNLPSVVVILIGGACAFLLSYLFAFAVKSFCHKVGWLDRPAARRVHTKPVPRLGGIAMFLAFFIASLLFYAPGPQSVHTELVIYWLLIVAAAFMVLVHIYDDVLGLSPVTKIIAQTIAVVILLGPGRTTFHGILLYALNNPFGNVLAHHGLPWYREPILYLFVHDDIIRLAAIPAVLFTWFWVVGMMNTVNWIDGLDGLATGVVAIAALFITIISFLLHQQSIAVLAAIFTGAILGFLPHNWNPAKIFMGDTGSMFLGLGLAVLSTIGGAKLALALIVLGVPILDVAIVMINRIRRGQSPLHYDKTHLHHRLLATGLSVRQICFILYGLTLIFGLLALSLSAHFSKLIGVGVVGLTMLALILWIDHRQHKRGAVIRLDQSDPSPMPIERDDRLSSTTQHKSDPIVP